MFYCFRQSDQVSLKASDNLRIKFLAGALFHLSLCLWYEVIIFLIEMFIITGEPATLDLKTEIFWRAQTQVDIIEYSLFFAGKQYLV